MFIYFQANIDLLDYAKYSKPSYLPHNHLVCIGSPAAKINQFFLIVDHNVIPCGTEVANAFKNLYGSFHVFNIKYPRYVSPFYSFFDEFVFQVKKNKTTKNIEFFGDISSC